jgi:hypothetical protein
MSELRVFVVIPSSLSDRQRPPISWPTTSRKFETCQAKSCGGLNIDAYQVQSEAKANSSTAGESTAGSVILLIGNSYQVSVDVGSVVNPDFQLVLVTAEQSGQTRTQSM